MNVTEKEKWGDVVKVKHRRSWKQTGSTYVTDVASVHFKSWSLTEGHVTNKTKTKVTKTHRADGVGWHVQCGVLFTMNLLPAVLCVWQNLPAVRRRHCLTSVCEIPRARRHSAALTHEEEEVWRLQAERVGLYLTHLQDRKRALRRRSKTRTSVAAGLPGSWSKQQETDLGIIHDHLQPFFLLCKECVLISWLLFSLSRSRRLNWSRFSSRLNSLNSFLLLIVSWSASTEDNQGRVWKTEFSSDLSLSYNNNHEYFSHVRFLQHKHNGTQEQIRKHVFTFLQVMKYRRTLPPCFFTQQCVGLDDKRSAMSDVDPLTSLCLHDVQIFSGAFLLLELAANC